MATVRFRAFGSFDFDLFDESGRVVASYTEAEPAVIRVGERSWLLEPESPGRLRLVEDGRDAAVATRVRSRRGTWTLAAQGGTFALVRRSRWRREHELHDDRGVVVGGVSFGPPVGGRPDVRLDLFPAHLQAFVVVVLRSVSSGAALDTHTDG
jgi:hypothetical protein